MGGLEEVLTRESESNSHSLYAYQHSFIQHVNINEYSGSDFPTSTELSLIQTGVLQQNITANIHSGHVWKVHLHGGNIFLTERMES